jgi:hypothetical protein
VIRNEDVYWAVFQILPVYILSVCGELLVGAVHQIRDDRLPALVSVLEQGTVAGAGQVQIDRVLTGGLYRLIYFGIRLGEN